MARASMVMDMDGTTALETVMVFANILLWSHRLCTGGRRQWRKQLDVNFDGMF